MPVKQFPLDEKISVGESLRAGIPPGMEAMMANGTPILDEAQRGAATKKKYDTRAAEARKVADSAAAHDRTDPFIWGRVYTHMMNGVGEEHAWNR